jgi:hypothetical protein
VSKEALFFLITKSYSLFPFGDTFNQIKRLGMNKNIVLAVAILAIGGCATHKTPDQVTAATALSAQAQTPTPPSQARSLQDNNVASAKQKNLQQKKNPQNQANAQNPGNPPGEILGTPAPDSKFARLKLGMSMRDVNALIGTPDDLTRHETGKRWIPFYFGPDAQRMEALYNKEGCLTYTGGNVFGGGGNQLIRIAADPKAACWNPS